MVDRLSGLQRRLAWGLVCLLTGCAVVGPDYVPPVLSDTDAPERWTSRTDVPVSQPATVSQLATAASPWWQELSDPVLDLLVSKAFGNSPTLEAALARLLQARAQFAQSDAARLPNAGAELASLHSESATTGQTTSDHWLSANASWEIDLFGAVRRGVEGAVARAQVQQATLADARVSLAADVADAYLSHRACQSQLALSEQDLLSREATEKVTAESVAVGFTAPYQGIRSKASVAEAKTTVAATRARCERLENLLTRLTGITRPVLMTMLADKPTGLVRLPVPRHFDIAVPTQALRQRPDIRAAERRLAAASADIGLAEADRYPRLTLSGGLGYAIDASKGRGALSLGTWSFGPALSLPIFDAGRRAAAVELAKSRYEEAYATFKAAARKAIQEIEDGLTRYAAAHERAENAQQSAQQYQDYYTAVELRYREGASNLLELEDARRVLLDAQQTLLGVQQERLQAWIALNRATGGAAAFESPKAGVDRPLDGPLSMQNRAK